MRPSGSVLKVTFFDAKGEAENIANISGFDFSSSHCFGFEKGEDGHWYLVIDSNRCDHAFYTRFDQFMETYGHAAHVSLGGRNGFLANNVIIVDKNSAAYSGDWNYSLPFGCSYSGNFENTTLNLRAGTQAVYNKKIEEPQKYSIRIATGLQSIRSDTLVGLLTAPDAKGNYNCTTSNGLVLRFINRPTASDNRTHILMLLGGKWVTVGAYEPSFIDEDCYTLTVEKSTDGHYYFRIRWASGTTVVKLNRTNQFYRSVQLDTLVENGGYFMFATNSHQVSANIEMSYSPEGIVDEADEDTKAVTDFILFFEKNFDALNARSKKTYESVYAEWQKVSFLTRNSVIADLMDDDAAYNLLLTVIDYKDGDLDEYYTETEERMVSKEELDQLIAEHQKDDTADYLITYPDGTVIANIKNLSKNLSKKLSNVVSIIRLPKTEKHFNTNGLLVLISVVLCGGIGVIRLQKERADTKNDHRKG